MMYPTSTLTILLAHVAGAIFGANVVLALLAKDYADIGTAVAEILCP